MFSLRWKIKGAIGEPFGVTKILGASKTRTALEEYAFSVQTHILKFAGLERAALATPALREEKRV